jgi:hypothetical protein
MSGRRVPFGCWGWIWTVPVLTTETDVIGPPEVKPDRGAAGAVSMWIAPGSVGVVMSGSSRRCCRGRRAPKRHVLVTFAPGGKGPANSRLRRCATRPRGGRASMRGGRGNGEGRRDAALGVHDFRLLEP